MKIHENYIKRCIELAKSGLGTTSPNPMVGSVIVYNGTIIGEGYTSSYGGNHAEVNAINSVIDKKLLKKATLYVGLEPCDHFGKTPPCSDLIVKYQIPKVIIGCIDPFDKVAGKGIEKLKKYGCEVEVGVLEDECVELNKRFFTYHVKKRPYIILKWAETKDGFISPHLSRDFGTLPKREQAKPIWITNQYSRQLVHKWRSKERAILVGTNTAINDNPKLDVRNWYGKNPIRIVLDKSLRTPKSYHLFDKRIKTIVLTEKKDGVADENLIFEQIDFSKDIATQICEVLYRHTIQSVIIEGGSQTLQTFIDADFWDEARVFIGDVTFNKGVNAPVIDGEEVYSQTIQSDILKILKNKNC
ncbi:MAG: bifunctional diaminohydroxyphosphoribosylaminopyrimidine deaminase/5-amino-6-(5-phosphoribosylamino)uracil reductase RibD [Flavobacteriaceae bacterium]|nr:bifunctional diaminohydroxyphosphoribosylaminopyrimidine deaminase/5-amino-6-(5-phosphoribosylamino)uracil reductase RibD [Flavobacteriaceae bacterium]